MEIEKPLIGIVGGKGQMGQFFLHFFQNSGFKPLISSNKIKGSNITLAKKANLILICTSDQNLKNILTEITPILNKRKDVAVCDICSVKKNSARYLKNLPPHIETFTIHPLFGPMVGDIKGQNVIFCKIKGNNFYNFLKNLLTKKGAKTILATTSEHDQLMSLIQVLPHLQLIIFNNILNSINLSPKFFRVHTPISRIYFDLASRIHEQDPAIYQEIAFTNPFTKQILTKLKKETDKVSTAVIGKDQKNYLKFFAEPSNKLASLRKIALKESIRLVKALVQKN